MIEAWKRIPDLAPESQASSKENASDGRYPPGLKAAVSHAAPQVKKSNPLDDQARRAPLAYGSPASAAKRRSSVGSNGNRTSPAMLDHKKITNVKVESATPTGSFGTLVSEDNHLDGDQKLERSGNNLRRQRGAVQ